MARNPLKVTAEPSTDGGESTEGTEVSPRRRNPLGESTEVTAEPSTGSPRLIPVPVSPTDSGRPDPPLTLEDSGNSSASSDRKCAPSQVPEYESVSYDHLPCDQLRNLCTLRGYHKKDARVARKTRLAALDAVARQPLKSNEDSVDTSSSVLGKRDRSMADPSTVGN